MTTLKSIIAAAISVLAIGGPAYAMPVEPLGPIVSTTDTAQDLRSPDAREGAATKSWKPFVAIDLRSPDTREAPVSQSPTTFVATDLRSPDAVTGTGTGNPDVSVVEVSKPDVATGFDWSDAGLGAGTALALALLAMGSAYAINKHRPVRLG